MRNNPKNRKSRDSDPFPAALRLLTYRDRSSLELSERLLEKGFAEAKVDEVINRCFDLGYLNDERYAFSRARALVSSGRAVGIKLLLELKKAGIDNELAEQALATAEAESDLVEILSDLCERRFPDFKFDHANVKEKRRVISFFQRRGFPLAIILDVAKDSN